MYEKEPAPEGAGFFSNCSERTEATRGAVEAIHASRDPRIREYNEVVKLLARLYRLRTGGRGSE